MSREKEIEIKKEDKKAFGKFVIIIIVSMFAGMIVGFLSVKIEGNVADAIASGVYGIVKAITPLASAIVTVISMIAITVLYRKSKSRYQLWDQEDEEEIERIESSLSLAIYISSINMILALFFFAAGLTTFDIHEKKEIIEIGKLVIWFASFIIAMIFVTVAQKKIVDFTKIMNPEKKGSLYDVNFSKKWEDSCDEAEQLVIYKASYKAYKSVSVICMALWFVCIVGAIIWNFGLVPVTMISIIWITLITTYTKAATGLSKQKLTK